MFAVAVSDSEASALEEEDEDEDEEDNVEDNEEDDDGADCDDEDDDDDDLPANLVGSLRPEAAFTLPAVRCSSLPSETGSDLLTEVAVDCFPLAEEDVDAIISLRRGGGRAPAAAALDEPAEGEIFLDGSKPINLP